MKKGKKNPIIVFIRCCPLVTMLLVSVLVMTGAALLDIIKGDAPLEISMEHPLFISVLMKGKSQIVMGDNLAGENGNPIKNQKGQKDSDGGTPPEEGDPGQNSESDGLGENASGDGMASADALASASADASGDVGQVWQTEFEHVALRKAKSAYYEDNDRIALTTVAPYTKVDVDYYKDALFIGDSRVQGLRDYGNIQGADFFCEKGLSVFDLMDAKLSVSGKGKRKLKKVLAEKQYKKIYIMLGVNELGMGYATDFQQQYQKNLEQIRRLQPDATFFLMGMMHVTNAYAKGQKVYNNDNIDMRNTLVAELANGIDSLYLDMNVVVCGKKGGLKKEYTWDGVHLKAEYYTLWVDFLNEHGYGVEQ